MVLSYLLFCHASLSPALVAVWHLLILPAEALVKWVNHIAPSASGWTTPNDKTRHEHAVLRKLVSMAR
jgi:hypothetical protein